MVGIGGREMSKTRDGIHVFGEGIISVDADTLKINLGVVTEGFELQKSQAQNAETISKVIQTLLDIGIKQENIKTVDYRIEPQYRYEDGKQVFIGYRVTHMLEIKTKQIKNAGLIVDSAVKSGANTVASIQFSIENSAAFYLQALTLATQDTINKADILARSYGAKFYRIPYLIEEEPHINGPVPFAYSALKAETQTQIEPGKLTIQARIKAYFHLI
jgi:uncharacterized protein